MNKKGLLIYNEERALINKGFINWFLEEAEKLNIELKFILKEDLSYGVIKNELFLYHKGAELRKPDFVVLRNNDPILSKQLENIGIKVFNSAFISEISNHKGRTHQFLANKGIPMLDTLFVVRDEFNPNSIPFSYPVVVKEVSGRGGNEVYKASSKLEVAELLKRVKARELIIQQMGDVPGRDVRVFVVGGEIIAAILRYCDNDFRANYSLGGNAKLYELSDTEKATVKKVIAEFTDDDLGFIGIDFLFAKDGSFIFNEIEDVAGSRTLYANSNINIVRLYLEHILRKIS
ncbi:hypothetical protein BKP35_14430 [Anaerobacillus arseniciselenatis]|uniref:ATP-grasp domain-containing protein n=1 Tax=Anaerobacillus arseniciselenatis TaxID=85682 RepID=A0A1S2LDF8_9BACI|nr:ATP-grasp domain-containing protein [Anaerobacillus arseniciselenatis]OIJ10290.1 hypothetical protein BKP35_14430 [Anaerobacillus arseniciselenatis]